MSTVFLSSKLLKFSNKRNKKANEIDSFVFGQKMNLFTKLFGCWHSDVSRPFSHGKTAYRSCLRCGARKQFNTETLETHGSFYFPPIIKEVRV